MKDRVGNDDLMMFVSSGGCAAAVMKWRRMLSGQAACLRIECTEAIVPRVYLESRVIAMCVSCFGSSHWSPFEYVGALLYSDTGFGERVRIARADDTRSNASVVARINDALIVRSIMRLTVDRVDLRIV